MGLGRECKLHEVSPGSRWREMVLLVVSWICVVLTAAEFIIKRVRIYGLSSRTFKSLIDMKIFSC